MKSNYKTDPFHAYTIHRALELHFALNSSYDAVKYNYTLRLNETKFKNSPEANWFSKIGERYDPIELKFVFVACWRNEERRLGLNYAITSLDTIYKDWQKDQDKRLDTFSKTLIGIRDLFNEVRSRESLPIIRLGDLLSVRKSGRGNLPYLLTVYNYKPILEEVCMLDIATGFVRKTVTDDNLIWPGISSTITKYKTFVGGQSGIDVVWLRKTILETFKIE